MTFSIIVWHLLVQYFWSFMDPRFNLILLIMFLMQKSMIQADFQICNDSFLLVLLNFIVSWQCCLDLRELPTSNLFILLRMIEQFERIEFKGVFISWEQLASIASQYIVSHCSFCKLRISEISFRQMFTVFVWSKSDTVKI